MNKINMYTLKALRKLYAKTLGESPVPPIVEGVDAEKASETISSLLNSDRPAMIGRFGATEMACILNYISIQQGRPKFMKYLRGEVSDWWWNESIMNQMQRWSGFFPPTPAMLTKFCEMMLEDAKLIDVCGVFRTVEKGLHELAPYMNNPIFIPFHSFEPYTASNPWSKNLENKRVVIIHPFAELIVQQYARRTELFDNKDVLPHFDLKIIKAVQSLGGVSSGFNDWFRALDWMKEELDKTDYDICLIGCGAYGFPLAAHAKRTGHKAIHLAGSLQLLFGIKGARWEKPDAGTLRGLPSDFYQRLFANPAWVRPDKYKTEQSLKVEDACYW